ncbi:MAG: DUF3237 domain-containing protein [Parvibaculum sp.]|uniref:DUF3237 domain-containing protein n=1 Tax=Parvibaculum sp. TaxID=2024848 RepID=UPI002725C1DB|nr:DUF3237 domain-containing protein [Parvibaculum sp.]MDO8839052.1 DUF3237 domain-containing protein [Parvibaculum sp.]
MAQFDLKLEHVFSYNATLTPPELIGPVPDNIRANFYVTGGDVWTPDGTRIGKVKGVGGDWLTVRRDNKGQLDVRATVETFDGALLYVAYSGFVDLGEGGYENLLTGKLPATAQVRAAPQICTSSPSYAWVNGCQFVNIGEVSFEKNSITYDTYVIR